MFKSIMLIALIGGFVMCFAQTHLKDTRAEGDDSVLPKNTTAEPDRSKQIVESSSKTKQKPNDPVEMLQQAYYLGGQLPADEHTYQLSEVVLTASKMHHPMLAQWVRELMQLTAGLTDERNRQYAEQTAMRALAEADPAEALHMLTQLPPAMRSGGENGTVPADSRTDAAREIFPRYWKDTKNPDIDDVRSAASYLGETGQYPFSAVALILKELGTGQKAEDLFFEAMQYYSREQTNDIQVHIEFQQFLKAARGSVPDAMERTGIELIVDRLLSQAARPMPDDVVFVGRVYTGNGFLELHSIAESVLYNLLPLVREAEPELEKRVLDKIPSLSNPVPSDLGSLPDGYSEAASILRVNPGDPQARVDAVARATDDHRAVGARRLADTDPETALRVANSIKDPALRSATLLTIAQGKLKQTDPEQAAKIISDARSMTDDQPSGDTQSKAAQPNSDTAKDDKAKLAALMTLARARAGENSTDLWAALSRGLDFAEEVFDRQTKAEPPSVVYSFGPEWQGPLYTATGFAEANALVKIGMEKQTANTLGWLSNEHDPRLKSYLLISAAVALANSSKSDSRAPEKP